MSGLAVPATARVVAFEDEASGFLDQDLYTRIELTVTPAEMAALAAQARKQGYAPLPDVAPVTDTANNFGLTATGTAEAQTEVAPGGAGLFRYVRDTPSASSLVVLDSARRRIVVQLLIL